MLRRNGRCLADGGLQELPLVQGRVKPAAVQQLRVGAVFGDAALVKDEDHVRAEHRGQPVGDDQAGAAVQQGLQSSLDELFGDGVQVGGGLVQDKNERVLQDRP